MTENEIMQLDADGIETRMSQIASEANAEGANLTALNTEVDQLEARRAQIAQQAESRANLLRRVSAGAGTEVRSLRELGSATPEREERTYDASSKEYRAAWMKNLAVRDNGGQKVYLLGKPNEVEERAFTMTTANSGSVVPTATMNRIIELVQADAPMYADAEHTNMTQGFGIPRHKKTTAGAAKGVVEGTANADSQDEFDLIALSGAEIKEHVVISRKMKFQTIDAFEAWLTKHLADQIAVAKEKHIIARLKGEAVDGGSTVAEAAVDSGNKLESQTYTEATMRSIMAKIGPAGEVVIYANAKTIWEKLAGIQGGDKKLLFVPSGMANPIDQGRIFGSVVKKNANLADNEVIFCVKGQVIANDFDEMEIFSAIEPKTANTIDTAYSLFDAGLQDPTGAVVATFTP